LFMETYAHAIDDITLSEAVFDTPQHSPTWLIQKPHKSGTS